MSIPLTDTATLHPLVLPARADAADAADLIEYARVRNASLTETTGRDDDHLAPAALLALLRSDADLERRQWLIRIGEEAVGLAVLNIIADDGGRAAFFTINLLRSVWSRGIGTAALRFIEQQAAIAGVARLLVWIEHTDADESRLDSPTGFGSIPKDHGARFLLRHGFALEQVERVSAFELSGDADRLRTLHAEAAAHAQGYRIVSWQLPTPAEFVDGYARLKQAMSTDAPDADLDMPEEEWDAERVARHDDRYLQRGETVLVTAAQHAETGELCAFNELSIGGELGLTTHQADTLVRSAHRGHRLGMLVKTAGLLDWRDLRPDSPRVITWNAEENRPMLSINEALGFTPIAYEGAWRKDLS
ncbi:N-acetyltransferase [Microbacterium sp. MYb72]|uniref:GNAT family N-acetyltransferase n=1 Tax=Microbacterium sp. MYb72 TaxID=1848693 RepID=UPI000CFB4686|nr:GNAT family N-acetyltransferase [Microbacterium sp. MYb72]PRB10982.1 N-acetyltransferase [Microbacterium sp. MYb72]